MRQKARRRQEELFEKFLYLVATHYRTQRSLNFYAEQMCLTPKYLSSIIKQASGESATEWIIHTVIRNAQALLENSQLTVQQVADYLNFPTPSFFGQYFKKHVGMTPKEYRLSKR
ncbi:MAG: helix-turn-helix domain-containing protein [Alistipes indistinctus]